MNSSSTHSTPRPRSPTLGGFRRTWRTAAGTGAVLTLLSIAPEQRDPSLAAELYEAVLQRILTDALNRTESGPMAAAVAFRAVAPGLAMLSEPERRLLVEWTDRAVDALRV